MVRHTIDTSPIHVSYGYDENTGIFLSVYDNRLKYDPTVSDEINSVFANCGIMGLASGIGAYVDLHTGQRGFGIKTTWPVMSEYLKRYGVPRNHMIDLLKKHVKHVKKEASSAAEKK